MGLASLRVLVVNAGSTSLKLRLVGANDEVERLDRIEDAAGRADAVAHRVVHGGALFGAPTLVDAAVRAELEPLTELAPLHNAPALRALDEARRVLPDVPHVAVFDSAFHGTIPGEAATYAVPERWRREWGIRRYGFHGLSVQWAAERVAVPRLIVCHLGGGCSVTAVRDGRSVDTTMGFTPLEGVPMPTRSGTVDPGALLHLVRAVGVGADELDEALNHQSGLRGLAGTDDVRELERRAAAGGEEAAFALGLLSYRVAGAVGAMAVAAGGLDALVFTAGIGEGSALVRRLVCARLELLGVRLDPARNDGCDPDCDVGADDSAARVVVVRAREELVAARAAREALA